MKLRFLLYSLIITFLLVAQCVCATDDNVKKLTDEDKQSLNTILEKESSDGMSDSEKERWFKSIQRLLSIMQADPETEPDLLLSLTSKQITLFPDERKAYVDAASVNLKLNKMKDMYEQAIKALKNESVFYRGDTQRLEATIYTMLGQYLLETKQYKRSYDALNKALLRSKGMALPFYLMGNVCFQLEKYQECRNAYSIAFTTEVNPAYPVDYFYYGIALHRNGETQKAAEMLQTGCFAYPNEPGLPLNYGYVLQRQDKLIEAYLEFFREQIIFGPNGPFNQAAQFNINMLVDLMTRRNNLRETQIMLHINQWDTLMNQEKSEAALEEMKQAIDLFGEYNWTLQFFLQMTYEKLEQYDNAIDVLKTMNRYNPHVVINYVQLAKNYFLAGDLEQSSEYFAKARKANPDNWKFKQMEESFQNALLNEQDK